MENQSEELTKINNELLVYNAIKLFKHILNGITEETINERIKTLEIEMVELKQGG